MSNADTTFDGVTVRHGMSSLFVSESAGGIYSTGTGIVHLQNADVSYNYTTHVDGLAAGGILASEVIIDNSVLSFNALDDTFSDPTGAGAIYADKTTITNSSLLNNVADGDGVIISGALYTAEMIISDSVFADNYTTQGYSGAIYYESFASTNSSIDSTTFEHNIGLSGGAILIELDLADTLTISNSDFTENEAPLGALNVQGNLTVTNCTFELNQNGGSSLFLDGDILIEESTFTSGANFGLESTIVILMDSTVTIRDSEFGIFDTFWGTPAIENWGGLTIENTTFNHLINPLVNQSNASLTLIDSTVTDSLNLDSNGMVFNDGQMEIRNSTFAGNPFENGSLMYNAGSLDIINTTFADNIKFNSSDEMIVNNGQMTITNTTIADNLNNGTGTLASLYNTASGTLTVTNTIIANTDGINCIGIFTDGGGNLEYPTTSCGFSGALNDGTNDPLLQALADNGGLTETMALGVGSPAINGTGAVCPAEVNGVDQRGEPRDALCDIGAFEAESVPLVITIDDPVVTEGAGGSVTVSISPTSTDTTDVSFTVTDGSATGSGIDYTVTSISPVTIPTNTSSVTIDFTTNDDSIFEGSEDFVVDLTGAVNATDTVNITDSQGTATINDNDSQPVVSLSPATVIHYEGDVGTTDYVFTVTLSNASSQVVTVDYSTNDDTATIADSDYVDNDNTLTFNPGGSLTKTVTVAVNGDIQFEDDEDFTLILDSAANAVIDGGNNTAIGTIRNDEATRSYVFWGGSTSCSSAVKVLTASSTITGDIHSNSKLELQGGGTPSTVIGHGFYVTNHAQNAGWSWIPAENNPRQTPLQVNDPLGFVFEDYTPGGSQWQVAEADPNAVTVNYPCQSSTDAMDWNWLNTEGYISGDVLQDGLYYSACNISIRHHNLTSNATTFITEGQFETGTPSRQLDLKPYIDGLLVYSTLPGGCLSDAVSINNNPITLEGIIYAPNSEIDFGAGDVLLDGSLIGYRVTVSAANGIFNYKHFDNTALPTVRLSPATLVQNEGESGTIAYEFTITLSHDNSNVVTVDYTTNDGTATLIDGDYADNDGTLIFNPSDPLTQTITVLVNGDIDFEADEYFTFTLNASTNASIHTFENYALGTIFNDDTGTPNDGLMLFDPSSANMAVYDSLLDNPDEYAYLNTPPTNTAPEWVMGDWNGDGEKTPGYFDSGAFRYTNDIRPSSNWSSGFWLGNAPGRVAVVAGRFDTGFANDNGNDCIGWVDSNTNGAGDLRFSLKYWCDMTQTPQSIGGTLSTQWLAAVLSDSQGFAGTHQWVYGDWDNDSLDEPAVRRGEFITRSTNAPSEGAAIYGIGMAQRWAGTGGGIGLGGHELDDGLFVAGDWNGDGVDTWGVVYDDDIFYYRDVFGFNPGPFAFASQTFTSSIATPRQVDSHHNASGGSSSPAPAFADGLVASATGGNTDTSRNVEANLSVSKAGNYALGEVGLVGDSIVWTITISNTGTAPANGVQITDNVPAELRVDDALADNDTIAVRGQIVTFTAASIGVGETVQFQVVTTILAQPSGGQFANRVNVLLPDGDANGGDANLVASGTVESVDSLPATGYRPKLRW